MFIPIPKLVFSLIMVVAIVCALPRSAEAGFLYVLNERGSAPNQIYGFSVNETTGALTPLAGFPVDSGGNGSNLTFSELLLIDRANFRLYVLNAGSFTISAFSINASNGALSPLPFSPFGYPANAGMRTLRVHPSGSPLFAGDFNNGRVYSFNITPTRVTAAAGNPYSTGSSRPHSSVLSRDGNFLYAGGSPGNFAGFGVNPTTGALTQLPGSPFNSGGQFALGFAADSLGRIFTANDDDEHLRLFTTLAGVPTAVTGNPFASGLSGKEAGALHPNEDFYYVSDDAGDRVGAYRIAGSGASTTLTPLAGSPVSSGGLEPSTIVLNNAGTFLFAANRNSRNLTTYSVNPTTGALTFNSVQPADTLGTTGRLIGMDYLPSAFSVLSTSDSGPVSLRAAVSSLNAVGGGIITFHPSVFNVPRTISLTSGQLLIESNISIVGTGANMLTIRNTAAQSTNTRVLRIAVARPVTITGITIAGGNPTQAGGAVDNSGNLTMRDCVVSGNTTGSVGGAIDNGGILSIVNSTIAGNHSSATPTGVGGIYNTGTLFVTNSTISGNTTAGGSDSVGGIDSGGSATVTNSTITNNSAPLGGVAGIRSAGSTRISNSIVAGNRNLATSPDVRGSFVSDGFNLIGNRGSVTAFNQTGDQTGTSASPLDPRLVKVLAYKGGPTPVHVPLPNSPAVDKGNNANIVADQRGFNRPFDDPAISNTSDGADIGAFERRSTESIFTAPLDFDGDNKTDIGIYRPSVAEWWINQSSTGQTFATQFGANGDQIMPGDITGDGKADITFWRPLTGFWFVLRSEDYSFFAFPFGARNDIPTIGDFDGDAKADATVFRPSTGIWFTQRSSDGGVTIQQFGALGDNPVPADYDGDGRTDIAIYRPSLGQWWLNRSTAGVLAVTFGIDTDRPVQGDYTGDGKSDVAFWRNSNGGWFILRSEDLSFFSFPFGASGDTPAPGDYDGDGRHDATVFRPNGATWFSQRSTAGTLIQQFGLANDHPIPGAYVPPLPNFQGVANAVVDRGRF